jgi:hypothetical protein
LKRLFISKRTARHKKWHKEGVRENDGVMVHPSDGESWKALDRFDADFTNDARNIHIGLATDGLIHLVQTPYHTLVGPSLQFHTMYHLLFA